MSEFEIIDRTVFINLLDSLGGDVDFMNELVEAYLASSPELIDSIRQAHAAGVRGAGRRPHAAGQGQQPAPGRRPNRGHGGIDPGPGRAGLKPCRPGG